MGISRPKSVRRPGRRTYGKEFVAGCRLYLPRVQTASNFDYSGQLTARNQDGYACTGLYGEIRDL
jgi:hypothetical protein